MYSTAFPTVLMLPTSSSGMSMLNSSSRAMTNSTTSRESAPRSSVKDAPSTTSSSLTPSSSTVTFLTLSKMSWDMVRTIPDAQFAKNHNGTTTQRKTVLSVLKRKATIDNERLSGDVRGLVAAQE